MTWKRAIGAAALLLALLLYFLWPRSDAQPAKPPPTAAERNAPPTAPMTYGPALDPQPDRMRPPPEANLPPAQAPIIDEVSVEKPEVCRGEENLITVKAHTPGGTDDAYLHYFVVDEDGQSVPLRLMNRTHDNEVPKQIIVFGRDNVSTTVDLPPYKVKDCDAPRWLTIQYRILPNTEGVYEFTAQIANKGTKTPMDVVRYHWDFGDGVFDDTDTPIIEHDLRQRPEDTMFSQILVGCTAIGADGEQVFGRVALQLDNIAFEEKQHKGMVKLFVDLDPRFPEIDDLGKVVESVHIWHLERQPVQITKLTVTTNVSGAQDPESVETVDVASVLGATSIPTSGLTTKVTLDTKQEPDVFSRDYLLEGVSADGYYVHGNFSLMRPPDMPTKDNSTPVIDPILKQKILRTRKILAKQYVTDEDIWALDKQGAFNDLDDAGVVEVPPAPPPPDLPK